MRKGDCNKAPGRDDICLKFFKVNWDSIKDDMLVPFNQMYLDGRIMEQQTHGVVVCIPKTDIPTTPVDYRPITLLNIDYKILARIIANRLRSTLAYMPHPNQHCGVPDNTIFDTVAKARDATAYAKLTHAPLCILSLDFIIAFNRISDIYLFQMLKSYGDSMKFITLIQSIYEKFSPRYQLTFWRRIFFSNFSTPCI